MQHWLKGIIHYMLWKKHEEAMVFISVQRDSPEEDFAAYNSLLFVLSEINYILI